MNLTSFMHTCMYVCIYVHTLDNLYNKRASLVLGKDSHGHMNAHWMLSAAQLLVGALFVMPQW